MAYSTISKPSLHFNTKLYTGNGSAGHSITGVGFQPDFVWIKQRDSRDHFLFNAISTATKYVASNTTAAEATDANTLTAFGADGFTLGSGVGVNENNDTHVSWNWKANGAGSANTDGSQSSTVSVNTTAGFSIVKFVNNQSYTTNTFGHGLGAVPKVIMMRSLDDAYNWDVYHHKVVNSKRLVLNSTASQGNSTYMNSTSPTNQVFTLKSDHYGSGSNAIAYCFAEKKGYSKFGSYTGNGNANGTFIYTGFKPAFLIFKRTDTTNNWIMYDNKRNEFNVVNTQLYADSSGAEGSAGSGVGTDILSNGFKQRGTGNSYNASGGTYIYMAFAAEPLVANVGSTIPATAR